MRKEMEALNSYGGSLLIANVIFNTVADIVCEDLNINKPEFFCYSNNESKAGAAYNHKEKSIYMNLVCIEDLMSTINDKIDFNWMFVKQIELVAHELRHAWQDANGKLNLTDYVNVDGGDHDKYWNHPIEKDARSYGFRMAREIRDMVVECVIGLGTAAIEALAECE